jgi:hypothetical protein
MGSFGFMKRKRSWGCAHRFRPTYAGANIDWIRKKASAILERVLRFGAERLRDQEKPYEDYRM